MSDARDLLEDSLEELYEDAPCGYLSTTLDGTIVKVNRTFENWTGFDRRDLLRGVRFQDLLAPGGQIYYETHFAPLLLMQGTVREVAFEVTRADRSRLPALVNSVVRSDPQDRPRVIRTTVFDATDRRRYEQELLLARREEQQIAHRLQRSLLSGSLPSSPDLQVEVAYQPGVSGMEVGGDWYDAFGLEQAETVALVVGDVVGRGLEAAADMGQLRSAVRAFGSTGLPPSAVLRALDRYAARHGVGRMATLVYARLDLAARRLEYACAGHPPPLLLAPGEEPRYLMEGRSSPLDSRHVLRTPRVGAALDLAPGSDLLLYTDGLIERHTLPLDDGLDRLLANVSSHRMRPPHGTARSILDALRDASDHDDDACVLLARLGTRDGRRPGDGRYVPAD